MTRDAVVYTHLKNLGIPASMMGYTYLKEAILIALDNNDVRLSLTKKVYPAIARKYETTPARVERSMRTALAYMLDHSMRGETLYRYFGNTVNTRTFSITNSQFIMGVAEYIRMEDKND